MSSILGVKICGLSTENSVKAALQAGANYIGFVFFPRSPRNVTPAKAAELAKLTSIPSVAVTVDMDDAGLDALFATFTPDYLQLHGGETPSRAKEIKQRYKVKVIKAISVQNMQDISRGTAYEDVADMLMFDTKPANKGLPGGTGISFDWKLLTGREFARPWFLSGGLGANNIEKAARISGARYLDASSLLETTPGVKSDEKIMEFVKKAKSII